jgi:ribonuclease P protein component
MMPKRAKLTAVEVRAILKSGRSARAGSLSAKFVEGSPSQAAVVVSAKVAKTAVVRNKLRRAAYAALRRLLPRGVRAVVFMHKPLFNPQELAELCSKLS